MTRAAAGGEVEPMMDETLLGIIPDLNWRRGFLKYAHATLVVTNKRLLVALRPKERAKEPSGEMYRTMGFDAIHAESPGNLAIAFSQIHSFRVESGQALSADDAPHPDRLILKTEAGKEVFTFGTHSLSAKEAKTLLEQVLGHNPSRRRREPRVHHSRFAALPGPSRAALPRREPISPPCSDAPGEDDSFCLLTTRTTPQGAAGPRGIPLHDLPRTGTALMPSVLMCCVMSHPRSVADQRTARR